MTGPGTNPAHLARTSDPPASHASAEEVASSRSAELQRSIILAAVRRYPGKTSRELARLIPTLDRYQVARRLPEIPEVYQCRKPREGARKCTISGRLACTWWPRESQPSLL